MERGRQRGECERGRKIGKGMQRGRERKIERGKKQR